jgi:enoyl-CoA hydratase/carnithine racemase
MNVRLTIEDHVATITLTRPDSLNAIDSATANELQAIWLQLEADADVRCIVLTGEGDRAFCVGADLKEPGKHGLDYWAHPTSGGFGGIALRDTLDIPIIARVNGYALGGGFEMMLGADIVVAVETAKFGLPEPRVGHVPLDGGAVLLQRQIPYRQAMGILLTGRNVSAQEALAMGLINEVVPREELDDAVNRWLKAILACSPTSLRAIKQCVRRTATLSPVEAQRARLPALIAALESEDSKEGVRAFREKRAPVWTGR